MSELVANNFRIILFRNVKQQLPIITHMSARVCVYKNAGNLFRSK